ncbi:MAG: NADH dehydrogenase subunit, partial [Candidatus Omnitrophota bacterium]
PTLANIQTVKHMLRDRFLADMPIVIAAIDPCFSCTDRLVGVRHLDNHKKETLSWESLRSFSLGWHRAKGFDITVAEKKLHDLMEH